MVIIMAEQTFENISKNARDLFQKAQSALERNNLDYAIEMYMQCLNLEPNFLRARQYLRAAQRKRHEATSAFKRVFTAATTAPLLTKAKIASSKNPVEAMALAEEVLAQDPQHAQALILLAEAAEAAGLPETAVQTLEYYSRIYPNDTRGMHILARTYNAMEKYADARDIYERLLQVNPNDFTAQKGLKDATARAAMQTGGWDMAQSYRDVIKDKEEAVALEQQSRVVRAEDMIENLIQENLTKLKHEPNHPVIRRELGKLYGQKSDYKTALEYLEKIWAEEAGGDSSLEKEIYDIKVKHIGARIKELQDQLAAKPPHAAELQAQLDKLQLEHDKLELTNAIRLVERYPNDLMYRFDLGLLYYKTGDLGSAIEQFQRAVGQPQRRVAALNYLGQCFRQLGLYDLAVDQFVRAASELPMMDNVKKEIVYNLGATYADMGDQDKAIAEFKKIAAVDFGYRDIRDRIIRKPPQNPTQPQP